MMCVVLNIARLPQWKVAVSAIRNPSCTRRGAHCAVAFPHTQDAQSDWRRRKLPFDHRLMMTRRVCRLRERSLGVTRLFVVMKPAAQQEVLVDGRVICDCGCSRRLGNQLSQVEFVGEGKLILMLGCAGRTPFHKVGCCCRRYACS